MRVRLKGVNRLTKRLATGKLVTYYYAWKGGPRLQGTPGSAEFVASYNDAVGTRRHEPVGQFRSLIESYESSPVFERLAPSTKKDYRWHLRKIEEEFGTLPISVLADRKVRAVFLDWRDEVAKRSRRQADFGFTVLARVISWSFDRGIAPANPCLRPGRLYRSGRAEMVWSEGDEANFYEKAPDHLHLALTLALWTGQRQGDLLRLTWSDFDGTYIRLKQKKTRAPVVIPVGKPLLAALKIARESAMGTPDEIAASTILLNQKGKPWTQSGFSASWRKACASAGVVGLTFHDLRGTAVTRLALAGASEAQIATVTGHALRDVGRILDAHYMKRDVRLAEEGIRKLELAAENAPNRTPNCRTGVLPSEQNPKGKEWWTH